MARPLCELGVGLVVCQMRLMGMNAYAGPDLWILRCSPAILLGQADAAVGSVRAFAIADGEVGVDASSLGALQHFVAVSVVALAFEMGVGVDEHG